MVTLANRIKGITLEINGDITGLDKALKGINTQISGTGKALKDVNRLLKLDPKNTELLSQKQKLLKDSIDETKQKLDQLKEADKVAKQQLDAGDLGQDKYDAIQREIAETEQKLKGLKKEYKEFGSVAAQQLKAVGDQMKKTGEKIADTGGKLTKSVSAPIAAVGTAAVKITADFDAQMSKVSAISGATGENFDRLRDKAREMGATTKFSATEASEAMEYMAMAGWKTGDMLDGIEGIMNLAAASGEDLATTSDIVTDALTAFGLKAEDSAHFADVLAAASSNANTNVSMLGESFKYAAPVAGAMGYSVEDVSTALGLMANAGIKASQGGTALRRLLVNMANPTETVQAAMSRLGVSLSDGEGNMYSFREIMDQLRSSFGQINMPVDEFNEQMAELDRQLEDGEISEQKYGKLLEELTKQAYGAEGAEKARTAAMLAGANGMSGLLAIVNASTEDYEKLTAAIQGCDGASKEMADVMQDNLSGQITLLLSALQELAISVGDILMPLIRKAVDFIQGVVDKLNSMDEGTKRMIVTIAGIVAAIGPVLLIIGKLIVVMGTIISSIGAIAGALALISGPVGIAILAIGGLIAIGVLLVKNWDEIVGAAKQTAKDVAEYWERIKSNVSDAVEKAKDTVKKNWNDIKTGTTNAFNAVKDGVRSAMETVHSTVTSKAQSAVQSAKEKFDSMKTSIKDGISSAADTVKDRFDSMKEAIRDKLDGAKSIVSSAVKSLKEMFKFKWNLPKIKLPHFSIDGKFDLSKLQVPKIKVDWYQKAMDAAMILRGPTIFGYDQASGKLMGGGEAGEEVITGKNNLLSMIKEAVASVQSVSQGQMAQTMAAAMQTARVNITYGPVTMNVYGQQGQDVRQLAKIVKEDIENSYRREKGVFE